MDDRAHLRAAGLSLLGLGLLHDAATVTGALANRPEGAARQWFDLAVFWSLEFGAAVALAGWIAWRSGASRPPLGAGPGLLLLAMAGIGAAVVPAGGFWLVLPIAVWIVARGLRQGPARHGDAR